MLKRHNAVDYLHSADNVIYSRWDETFAWLPVKTLGGERVWLTRVFRRKRTLLNDIPQFPVKALDKVQYATFEEIVERKLKGLP